MNYTIKNYIDNNGKEPITDWLKSLEPTFRKRVLLRFTRLQEGNFGDNKRLDEFLYELRFSFGAGYRVYYTILENTIILLINGGDKKSQSKDISTAKLILQELNLKEYKHEKH